MTSETPGHDFLLPRLKALIEEATANGIARDVAVAVLTDLVTGPEFNGAAPDPTADSEPHPDNEPGPSVETQTLGEKDRVFDSVVAPRGYI